MTDLIAALEAAEVGSRELSDRTLLSAGWKKSIIGHFYGPMYAWTSPRGDSFTNEHHFPSPTESLDAAMLLALPGWSVANIWESDKPKDRPWWGVALRRDDPYKVLKVLGMPTLPLALSDAWLRAREA